MKQTYCYKVHLETMLLLRLLLLSLTLSRAGTKHCSTLQI